MSEFKAQILGILLVIGVFAVLKVSYETLIENTVNTVTSEVSEVLASN